MKRDAFLKMGGLLLLMPLTKGFDLKAAIASSPGLPLTPNELLDRMVKANDQKVGAVFARPALDEARIGRQIGYEFASLAAAWVSPGSKYYHDQQLVPRLETMVEVLKRHQSDDGTVSIGNLESPPDTAFLIEILTGGAHLLLKDNSKEIAKINTGIKEFLVRSGEGLRTGGVHTPNHRWVISAALARLNALYPNQAYVNRIEDWLGEGIYNDSDGHYPERSGIYSGVENTAFITMGRLLNKPDLFVPVRKNLAMVYYYIEPNGDLVTTDSRRQDQYMSNTVLPFYLHYRFMAIKDQDAQFAGIAKFIEQLPAFDKAVVENALVAFLENPQLQENIPAAAQLPENYEKLFTTSGLLRIRRGSTTTTLFGGVDWPIVIASGRSNSPNFFAYRKGKAILRYARLSSGFFSMGYFYSEGINKEAGAYRLHKKLEVPYYQPLPRNLRNSKGDYKLSPSIDDRFWNKMDFSDRPVSNVKTLDTTITLTEKNGVSELNFQVDGLAGIPVTIELCFDEKGNLSGVTPSEEGNSFLENGFGKFENEGDTITFGPGTVAEKSIKGLEGERYSTHFGSLRTKGKYVYLTGVTPFSHRLVFS